jgi:large conductance mechanosensitive channel
MQDKNMWKEFKAFIARGNMVDMAVGVIIGAAFGKIISSMVSDVIMPPIGYVLGKVDFSNLAFTIHQKTADSPAVVISYGAFINTIINFLIVSFFIFIVIKQMNRLMHKKPDHKPCPFCCSSIDINATRCPQCTSMLAQNQTETSSA